MENSMSREGGLGALLDLSFRTFITISIIRIIYILGLVGIGLFWLITMVSALMAMGDEPLAALFTMLIATFIGLISIILWRVYLEIVVVFFRIAENTSIMAGRTNGDEALRAFPVVPSPQSGQGGA